jgi:hypothetical protein
VTTLRTLAVLIATLAPGPAWACTWCVSSAFGDRSFNWPYLGLILAPFGVSLAIAGVLAWRYRAQREADPDVATSEPLLDKETT